ncbi:PadR family transcriptional regulator [Imperialibacter roseus]|uniref:PadR family transcriptional regulator n=1 Tax=Imperialibacter roseus TaxID=1324217 RepID=A0ABZ0IVQ5_9BACT|nr:PadR family transcriptional regulator [Imperialibacter roseus]WOK09064.1 PadR family transcriptional regulator [Imperialibacter roseus]|tara:strand:+ start:191 stop:523 length:333 start_codon:yes stop_codon:yes gene_type:complete
MKGDVLGEFEEIILLIVGVLGQDAYGLGIRDELEKQTGRSAAIGAVHATLNRLQEKGYVESGMTEGTQERGGRRKRVFQMTGLGKKALIESKDVRVNLWSQLPDLNVGKI